MNTATAAAIYGATQPIFQGLAVGTATVASAGLTAWYFQDLLSLSYEWESDANRPNLIVSTVVGAGAWAALLLPFRLGLLVFLDLGR